ncbi:MAG: DUF2273 domain-containing protein [Oscillospiraceae bacterium]|jgi:uncharacterized membrane protein|nr:DUF2273 domain-containing protein [Oscillospiraceae bacterium]
MPSDHEHGGFWSEAFKPGTAACALLCGLLGIAVAVSFLAIGFWKTLLIAAFFTVGWALGRSKAVRVWIGEAWRRITNRNDYS